MSITETYYLIDFENVHKEGLSNANKLGSHDHIHIFFTNNNKITPTDIAPFKSKSIEHQLHNVPSGKQSLDMHLVTYLGFLIGSNTNKKCKYIIVSKDKGFDKIISFLKKESPANTSITRQPKIGSTPQKTNIDPIQKNKLNVEILHIVSQAGYTEKIMGQVASIVAKCYGRDEFLSNVRSELKNTCSDYCNIYNTIEPILKKYS